MSARLAPWLFSLALAIGSVASTSIADEAQQPPQILEEDAVSSQLGAVTDAQPLEEQSSDTAVAEELTAEADADAPADPPVTPAPVSPPAPVLDAVEPLANDGLGRTETIRERYPNRAVKIEREVIRDEDDNYVNHGSWRMWDTKGTLVAEGQYAQGERSGTWTGWFNASESNLLKQPPYNHFQGPFVSQATFENGRLSGSWIVFDGKQNKISQWEYLKGRRHGQCVSWYANGRKMQEIDFAHGELHGMVRQWDTAGKLVVEDTYQHSRRLGTKAETYRSGSKQSEGTYLFAKRVLSGEDDWWNLELANYVKEGEDLKHGEWRAWYPNGQLRVAGKYENNEPVDGVTWTWWHANGQKSAEGEYRSGLKHDRWTWWHANGQKQLEGTFEEGDNSGLWVWWTDTGKVLHKVDYLLGGEPSVEHNPEVVVGGEQPKLKVAPRDVTEPEERQPHSILVIPRTADRAEGDATRQ